MTLRKEKTYIHKMITFYWKNLRKPKGGLYHICGNKKKCKLIYMLSVVSLNFLTTDSSRFKLLEKQRF